MLEYIHENNNMSKLFKNDLINKLLIENNTNYLINTKIVPFNVFINYTNKYSNELLLLKAFKILHNIKKN